MNDFVASNGWRVAVNEVPGRAEIDIVDSHGGGDGQVLNVLPSQVDALREFFLAERDAELGRWRSKEHPEYVVYKLTNSLIRVTNEATGEAVTFTQKVATGASASHSVAREFFAAHPEPKPWHDAKPGEAWVITIDSYMVDAPAVMEDSGLFRTRDGQGWTRNHEQITAGRRIWPEEQKGTA